MIFIFKKITFMINLDRIITESINEQVNKIVLQEDIDRQNSLCEQV